MNTDDQFTGLSDEGSETGVARDMVRVQPVEGSYAGKPNLKHAQYKKQPGDKPNVSIK